MINLQYTALNNNGKQVSGLIQSPDLRSAKVKLRSEGLFVTSIDIAEDKNQNPLNIDAKEIVKFLVRLKPVTAMQKVFFFRQLSVLLRSGMSLSESLHVIESLVTGRFREVVSDIYKNIIAGTKFSQATAKHPEVFSEIMCHMIRSAEATGELDVITERIAIHLERRAELKRHTLITLLYPTITLLLAIALFIFLSVVVIPKFAEFIQNSGRIIPPATQALLDTSNFMQNWGVLIFSAIIASIIIIIYLYRKTKARMLVDRFLLRVPVFGDIIHISAMSQLSWGLSVLLKSGLTIVESLEIVKNLVSNSSISSAIHDARQKILNGGNLKESFRSKYVSPLVQQMASVGERSGSLDQIMHEAGNYFEEVLKAKSKVLASLVEPIAILIIGGMVGFVYIAFFKAIFAISGG